MRAFSLVRNARRRARLAQSELAHRLGVPQSTVARWETGRIEPSLANVVRAVRACDLELTFGIAPVDHELRALVDAHPKLTPAQRFAQNRDLVNFVQGARRRMAAARG